MIMNFGILIPIVAILASAWVLVSLIRFKQHKAAFGSADSAEGRETGRLAHDNERLRRTVDRLEERLAVLERIATDPAERTAREIERLRQD